MAQDKMDDRPEPIMLEILPIIHSRISPIFNHYSFVHTLLFQNNSHLFLRGYTCIRNESFRIVRSLELNHYNYCLQDTNKMAALLVYHCSIKLH